MKDDRYGIVVYWHDFAMESHRTSKRFAELLLSLHRAGVDVRKDLSTECDVAFLGAYEPWETFVNVVNRENEYRRGIAHISRVKTAAYVWDLYPAKMEQERWKDYAAALRTFHQLLVPNEFTRRRVEQYCRRKSTIVHPAANFFSAPIRSSEAVYALNVVRPYPWDGQNELARKACDRAGIEYRSLDGSKSPSEFESLVTNASCLVSGVKEASTGGLTLFEGFALGVPVVIPSLNWNGAAELFQASIGKWTLNDVRGVHRFLDENDAANKIKLAVTERNVVSPIDGENVKRYMSDDAFVGRLVDAWKTI